MVTQVPEITTVFKTINILAGIGSVARKFGIGREYGVG